MAYFALKISDPGSIELVNSIKTGNADIEVSQLNQLESDLKKDSCVFIQLGGDRVPWDKVLL